MDVERYPNGRIKYKRDSKREYELKKQRGYADNVVYVQSNLSKQLANDFDTKLAFEDMSRSAKIRSWIEEYCYGDKS